MIDGFAIGLDRALTISRTEVLRAYRHGSQDRYQESGIVSGYKRLATHDGRVCLGCLFAEGEMFDTAHDFEAHPNCRCTLVPVVTGVDSPEWLAGKDWFEAQRPERQRELLGGTRYDLWQRGEVPDLRDFARRVHDSEWGGAFVPTPIRDLRTAA
jgi:SPP1 gp7 family putative phage head morphogenesis protein